MSSIPQVLNTLNEKADRISAHIASLEREIDQARTTLAHVNATIVLFEAPDAQSKQPALMDVNSCLSAVKCLHCAKKPCKAALWTQESWPYG